MGITEDLLDYAVTVHNISIQGLMVKAGQTEYDPTLKRFFRNVVIEEKQRLDDSIYIQKGL